MDHPLRRPLARDELTQVLRTEARLVQALGGGIAFLFKGLLALGGELGEFELCFEGCAGSFEGGPFTKR